VQITLTIAEPLLDRVDELAGQIGQSRAAVINLAVMQMLQSGLRIEGEER
jgi:metal-responsive CopG/Arc/MetJ family transcriptional regulator